jgi:hypothetical protein
VAFIERRINYTVLTSYGLIVVLDGLESLFAEYFLMSLFKLDTVFD